MTGVSGTAGGGALHRARVAAFAPTPYIGQEGFATAGEIRVIATHAGVRPGCRVLDLCCGEGGPGRLLYGEFGCDYLGVDRNERSVAAAREALAGTRSAASAGAPEHAGANAPYEVLVRSVPPLPGGTFDVVVMFETLLAFRDKAALVDAIRGALRPGGRLALTAEIGEPLDAAERRAMPESDTVWPVPLLELQNLVERNGFRLAWLEDRSASHLRVVSSLVAQFTAHEAEIASEIGRGAIDTLLTGHRLWRDWLRTGRIQKYALVATRV